MPIPLASHAPLAPLEDTELAAMVRRVEIAPFAPRVPQERTSVDVTEPLDQRDRVQVAALANTQTQVYLHAMLKLFLLM